MISKSKPPLSSLFIVKRKKKRVKMKYDATSSISTLSKVPGIMDEIEKVTGTKVSSSMLEMAAGMSLQEAANYVGWGKDKIDALVAFANGETACKEGTEMTNLSYTEEMAEKEMNIAGKDAEGTR
jgi:hypothetical protein